MAIGKKIVGSREYIMVTEMPSGEVFADSAIDVQSSDIPAYRESLWDRKHLKLFPGEEPTVFTIKPLTKRQKDAADGFESAREKGAWFVRCGLVNLRNYKIVNGETAKDAPPPIFEDRGNMGQIVSNKWLEDLDLPENQLLALFLAIREISEAQPPLFRPLSRPVGAIESSGKENTE